MLGDRVLPVRAVERAVYPFLGPGRDIDSVKAAAAALEKTYKDAGYGAVYVDIPEQEVDEGIVRLKVTEGRLEQVRIRGARYFSNRQILAALPALQPGESPHLPSLQAQLTAINARSADRQVTPILKAGSDPGTMDVDLVVKDQLPLHASVQYDNRHTADSTPNRLTASASYDNLWQRQDSISLLYQTAPADPKNLQVYVGTYLAHVPASSALVSFSYIHTASNVLALGTLGVLGAGDIYGVHWLQALPSTDRFSGSVQLGADYKDVQSEVFPGDTSSAASSAPVTAPVKYINWSGSLSQAWRLPLNTFVATETVNFGIEGLVNHTAEFENARYNADPSYLYVRLSGQATQNLPIGLSALARASGQWSTSPLVDNEQFSLGGQDTVRGYLEAETLGDSGVAGSFELHLPDIGRYLRPALSQFYVFGFIDGGVATLLDALPAQAYHVSLWSTGAGFQLASPWGLSGTFDYAVPQENGPRTPKGDYRLDFAVRYGF